jgi:hypothetical protein
MVKRMYKTVDKSLAYHIRYQFIYNLKTITNFLGPPDNGFNLNLSVLGK